MTAARFIPAPDQGDAQVVVLAAELFPERLVLVLAMTIWDEVVEAGLFKHEEGALRIEDDLGTEYRRALQVGAHSVGPGWNGSHGVHRANLEYEPPVPAEATYLRVTLGRWGSVVLMV
jgi:hypothetical protein